MTPRSPRSQQGGFGLDDVIDGVESLPERMIVHGGPGSGKTSFAAQAPSPIFLMSPRETGLLSLIDAGSVPPEVRRFKKPADNWHQVTGWVQALILNEHPYKTLVLDTLNGICELMRECVCQESFGGDWSTSKSGYNHFGAGEKIAVPRWREFINLLEKLRERKRMAIIGLVHSQVKKVSNPEGDDFDRWNPAMPEAYWQICQQWADTILFKKIEIHAKKDGLKVKVSTAGTRILHTTDTGYCEAKNRSGLPTQIVCGPSAAHAWQAYLTARAKGRTRKVTPSVGTGEGMGPDNNPSNNSTTTEE